MPVAKSSAGWPHRRLGDVAEILGGGTPSRANSAYYTGTIPWLTVKDLDFDEFEVESAQEHITDDAISNSATRLVAARSVIVATRVGLGKAAINAVPVAINQDLKALVPRKEVTAEYLLYFLKKSVPDIQRLGQGTTVKGIRLQDLAGLSVPIPPPDTQKWVVDLLTLAHTIRRKRNRAASLCEPILASAFADLFGSRGMAIPWPSRPLGELAEVRSGITKGRRTVKETSDVAYLRVANVQQGYLDLSEIKTIDATAEELAKFRLEVGDVLVTEGGDPDKVGRGAIWRDEVPNAIYQNHLFRVRPDASQLLPEYLDALLRTAYAKDYFFRAAKRTSNLASINSSQVRAFPVPLPPVALQRKFVMTVGQWEATKRRLGDAAAKATEMFDKLLDHAFRQQAKDSA
ncbi:MAG TPA: restriction endonuclease subunit S [Gemmatimonadaceae bacterium]|nr:restriction endonuclease subunit S [Gemmatimonadaceae bacterium]